jgi:ATP-dependent RNA helicase DDX51/DBP6
MQEKTKAKKRYLRRKKERRKFRAKQPGDAGVIEDDSPEEPASETDTPPERGTASSPQQVKDAASHSQRSSKRRKLSPIISDENATTKNGGVDADSSLGPDQFSTLPVFPLPIPPNAPSKSTLALQGLDKALVDAEFIDPDITRPIPLDGTDGDNTRLSDRMRRRLHDLGITELFAGELLSSASDTNLN